jgi:hypothetical protein
MELGGVEVAFLAVFLLMFMSKTGKPRMLDSGQEPERCAQVITVLDVKH